MQGVILYFFAWRASMSMNARTSSSRMSQALLSSEDSAVSTTSVLVRPKCRYLDSSPRLSATQRVKATTSWRVVCSISSMRSTVNLAFSRIFFAASAGTLPSCTQASVAFSSTSSQLWKRRSFVHSAAISGRV